MSTVETSEPIAQHSRILFVRVALTLRFACRLGCTPLNHAITKQSKWSKGPKVATIQELVGVCQLLILSRANVNFRDKLGGFQSVQQVSETYGLPDSVFQKIALQLRPSPVLRKLKINTATVEELATHPYLRFSDARMIVNYREEHEPYSNSADLDKLYGLEESTKKKIAPYLSFE